MKWIYCLPVIAVLLVALGYQWMSSGQMRLCNHPYALCTSARCIPEPGNPSKAICFCNVEEGTSASTVSCKKLQPSTDEKGIRTLYSTFSLKQAAKGKKAMRCPKEAAWTWCLNKRCTVDPSNPKLAICLCDVMRTKDEWTTFGGNCDPSTCHTAYWSGAALKDLAQGNRFMMKNLNLLESPVKWCEIE